MRLAGKTAIVTGAARGLGFGCARRFAAEGAAVAVVDIEQEQGEKAAAALREKGRQGDLPAVRRRLQGAGRRSYRRGGQGVAAHMVARRIKGAIANMCFTSAVMTMPELSRECDWAAHPHHGDDEARLWDDVETRSGLLSRTPLGRFGDPEDVAGLALYLVGEDAGVPDRPNHLPERRAHGVELHRAVLDA